MEEKPTLIYIPPNVGGGAKGISIGGVTTVRNLIEAVVVFFSALFLMLIVRSIIRIAIVNWIIIFLGLALAFFCALGVNGEPMSIFFLNVMTYSNRRIFVTLRPPVPREKEKDTFSSSLEEKIQNFATGKRKKNKDKEGEDQ